MRKQLISFAKVMKYHWGITSQLKATGLRVFHSSYLQKVFQHTEIQPLVERKSDVILKNKVLQSKFTQTCVISNSVGETEPESRSFLFEPELFLKFSWSRSWLLI